MAATAGQGQAPVAQLQPGGADQAEFVICDQTIERTFGWWNRYRRLSKDYEVLPATSETVIRIAMINLMVQRLAGQRAEKRREKQTAKRIALQQARE